MFSNIYDPIITPADPRWDSTEARRVFGNDDTYYSTNWQILNPVIKCDVCQMDSELNN